MAREQILLAEQGYVFFGFILDFWNHPQQQEQPMENVHRLYYYLFSEAWNKRQLVWQFNFFGEFWDARRKLASENGMS
jgi:hypothetical protein